MSSTHSVFNAMLPFLSLFFFVANEKVRNHGDILVYYSKNLFDFTLKWSYRKEDLEKLKCWMKIVNLHLTKHAHLAHTH